MGSTNLAIVFGPTLLSPKIESIEHTLMMPRVYAVIQCLIEKYDILFKEDFPKLPPCPSEGKKMSGPALSDPIPEKTSVTSPRVKNTSSETESSLITTTDSVVSIPDNNNTLKRLRPAKSVGRIPTSQIYETFRQNETRSTLPISLNNTPLEDNTDEILRNRNSLKSLNHSDKSDADKKANRDRPIRSMRSKLSLKKSLSMIAPRDSAYNSISGSLSARDSLIDDMVKEDE